METPQEPFLMAAAVVSGASGGQCPPSDPRGLQEEIKTLGKSITGRISGTGGDLSKRPLDFIERMAARLPLECVRN
jgi:hypothetical protein